MRLWRWYLRQWRFPRTKIEAVRRERTGSLAFGVVLAVGVAVLSMTDPHLWASILFTLMAAGYLARGVLADLELARRERGDYPPSDPDGRRLEGEDRLAHLNG
jgi:hypothetical protein